MTQPAEKFTPLRTHSPFGPQLWHDRPEHNYNIIGYINGHPTMHYFGIPRHTPSLIAYKILTEYFWKFQSKITLWEYFLQAQL